MMHRLRRFAAVALPFLGAFLPGDAHASFSASELWWNPSESGWGVNVIQQNNVLFITLFVYGADGKATWYVGPATTSTTGAGYYTGPLYVTTGPPFQGAFNPSAVTNRQVGTITFDASCATCDSWSKARLTYTVDGVRVDKTIERQTWSTIRELSSGFGAISKVFPSSCSNFPAGPSGGTFSFSRGALSFTAGSTNYLFTVTAGKQYGTVYEASAGTFSITGAPAMTGAAALFTVDGRAITAILMATGPGNCLVTYNFVGYSPL